MKQIIFLWLAALMFAAQPLQAAVCIGFGQTDGGGAAYTDDFNRADENPIGAPWAQATGWTNSFKINSNKITGRAEGGTAIYYNATFSANQYSQTRPANTFGGVLAGPMVRVSSTATTGYVFMRTNTNAGKIAKWVAGTSSDLQTSCSGTYGTSNIMRLEATGSSTVTLTAKIDGSTVCTVDDSSSTITSGYPGVWAQNWQDDMDDWAGGDL